MGTKERFESGMRMIKEEAKRLERRLQENGPYGSDIGGGELDSYDADVHREVRKYIKEQREQLIKDITHYW